MEQVTYTTINHTARRKMGLSWLEYGLADLIYNLQSNPKSEYPGWCYSSKENLASNLDTTKQTVHTLLNKLISKKLVEKHPQTKHLRITIDWYNAVIIKHSKETLPPVKEVDSKSKETLPQDSKETLHNKDIYNKDNNINNITPYNPPKERWATCPLKGEGLLKEKYPKGHQECEEYLTSVENHRKRGFAARNEQFFRLHDILKAGYDFEEIDQFMVRADKEHGVDLWDFNDLCKIIDKKGGRIYGNKQETRPAGNTFPRLADL